MSSSAAINGGLSVDPLTNSNATTGKSSDPTDCKAGLVASKGINQVNQANGSSLNGRVSSNPVGRTWPQFGQLVASKITFGWIPAPMPRVPSAVIEPVSNIPESVGPQIDEEKIAPRDPTPPAPTFVSRALDAVKSFFTAIYNMLFGVRSA